MGAVQQRMGPSSVQMIAALRGFAGAWLSSNLDARLRLQTREELRRIQNETGITTVFVTHDQEEAMSISDMIVIMKDGLLQQIGKPQEVYDDPINLFVARFIGTPAINVFNGRIEKGRLFIGEDAVLDVPGLEDREVFAAVRPEGLLVSGLSHFRFSSGSSPCGLLKSDRSGWPIVRLVSAFQWRPLAFVVEPSFLH